MSSEILAGLAAFLFTLMIFSYLIGDNPLFRIAVHVFVGLSAGYVASVAWWQVLWPRLILPLAFGSDPIQRALLSIPLLLCGLFLMKAWPSLARLGNPAMAMLVGVSAAVAAGGAVTGTLIPQVSATVNAFDLRASLSPLETLLNGSIILGGAVTTLAYFHFGARTTEEGTTRRFVAVEMLAFLGSLFLALALGVLFAGVYSAALTAWIERLHFLWTFLGLG